MDEKKRFLPIPFIALGFLGKIKSFIGSFFGFILKYWKQVLIVSMIVLILYQNFARTEWLKWVGIRTIPGLILKHQQELKDYIEALQLCEDGRTALKMSIEQRNEEIDQWAKKSEELKAKHDELAEELEKMKIETDEKIEQILNAPTPANCENAIDYLRHSGGQRW